MSKPIFLTEDNIDRAVSEFRKSLEGKISDGKVSFSKVFSYAENVKANVLFTPVAYAKMVSVLHHFDSEVAWHGAVTRQGDNTFIISDIDVFPQIVTGSDVTTDQEKYQRWFITASERFGNDMLMQGHSHVNFSPTPSSVDETYYEQMLSQLGGQGFYVFMIFNKRMEHTIRIYDYDNNVFYEDQDIHVGLYDQGFDLNAFLATADQAVTKYDVSFVKENSAAVSTPNWVTAYSAPHQSKGKGKKKNHRWPEGDDYRTPSYRPYPSGNMPHIDWDQVVFGKHDIED